MPYMFKHSETGAPVELGLPAGPSPVFFPSKHPYATPAAQQRAARKRRHARKRARK